MVNGVEKWLPIPGHEDYFEVSDQGRVRTVKRQVFFTSKHGLRSLRTKRVRFISHQKINSGYLVVHLSANRKRRVATVHSVVAEAFIGPRPKGFDVCHKNGNRSDNRAINLRYDTRVNNHADKITHGTNAWGEKIKQSKLKRRDVFKIRKLMAAKTQTELAKQFKVSRASIRRIRDGVTWRHLTGDENGSGRNCG